MLNNQNLTHPKAVKLATLTICYIYTCTIKDFRASNFLKSGGYLKLNKRFYGR